jgi:hypothetical protein
MEESDGNLPVGLMHVMTCDGMHAQWCSSSSRLLAGTSCYKQHICVASIATELSLAFLLLLLLLPRQLSLVVPFMSA